MKKNKKQVPEKQNDSQSLRRRKLALSKIQENRSKEKTGAEMQKKAVFAKKLLDYPSKQAPKTLRTRGYYRFTRDYPMTVDSDGLRDNSPTKKRIIVKEILFAFSVLLVFSVSFLIAKTCVQLSSVEPKPTDEFAGDAENVLSSFLHFSAIDDIFGDIEALKAEIEKYGCTGALIEIKDTDGHIYLKSIDAETIKALKADGVQTAAYISCFKDSVSPDENNAFRIRKNSYSGEIWTDNSGSGWLNPFSEEARNHILSIVSSASELGFDLIVLDNVCFPSDSGSSTAYYSGESEYIGSRNQLLRGFVGDAVSNAKSAQTVLMLSFSAFDSEAGTERAPYYGNMLDAAAGILCADARISLQQKNVTVGTEKFTDPSELPYAFILSAGEYASESAGLRKAFLCFDKTENFLSERDAAVLSGVSGYIIW